MTLILELPPELELKVREAANEDGVDVSVFLRKAAKDRLRQHDPARSMSEGDLVTRINQFGFSEAFWDRFRALAAKREAGTLTPQGKLEQKGESCRITALRLLRMPKEFFLFQLALRRSVTVQDVMMQLGLNPVPFNQMAAPAEIQRLVAESAGDLCEYCRCPPTFLPVLTRSSISTLALRVERMNEKTSHGLVKAATATNSPRQRL